MGQSLYIETYGCQMNVNDSELVASILADAGYTLCQSAQDADVVLLNTCAIRDNAETRILGRLAHFRNLRATQTPHLTIGVLGCMASRLKGELLSPGVGANLVVGPDSYRELPRLLTRAQNAVAIRLSDRETYQGIAPLRYATNGVSAFVSIMRGCDNHCTFCVVPFTRGTERSRDPLSILQEVEVLRDTGYREVTLLGQNVDSYQWSMGAGDDLPFAGLLERVARQAPDMRIRFSTSYPNDLTEAVLRTMAQYGNICPHIHLPVQSGSDRMLRAMRRKYTRAEYLQQVARIRAIIPTVAITTDIIAGFCGEQVVDHQATLSLMREVGYDAAFMFKYSDRPGTYAHNRLPDDVPEEVKTQRLVEIIELQNELSLQSNMHDVGREFEVLVEGDSKRSAEDACGRTGQNKMVVFKKQQSEPGQYTHVRIVSCTSQTLLGELV